MTCFTKEEEFEDVCGHGGKLRKVVRGWDSVFLKVILLSSLLGTRHSFSTKKGTAQHGLEENSCRITTVG